jgi:hypothetical protein
VGHQTREEITITVEIGKAVSTNGDLQYSTLRTVEFQGEEVATYNEPGLKDDGSLTDTRGRTETLYHVEFEHVSPIHSFRRSCSFFCSRIGRLLTVDCN